MENKNEALFWEALKGIDEIYFDENVADNDKIEWLKCLIGVAENFIKYITKQPTHTE